MKTFRFVWIWLSAVLIFPRAFCNTGAVDFISTSVGTVNWGDPAIWSLSAVPNSEIDKAILNGSATVVLADEAGNDASFTVRALDFKFNGGGAGSGTSLNNAEGGSGVLNFNNGSERAELVSDKGANRFSNVNVGIVAHGDLVIYALSKVQLNITKGIRSADGATTEVIVGGQRSDTTSAASWVTLSQVASTYTGATKIDGNSSTKATDGGGKLRMGMDNALPPGTVLEINPSDSEGTSVPQGGCLDLNGHILTVSGLSGELGVSSGRVTNLSSERSVGTLIVDGAEDFIFSGSIADGPSGVVALTKKGAGIQSLVGDNAYSGATVVESGGLLVGVAGAGSLGNSAVMVNTGTLGGTGSIGGPVTVGDGSGQGDAFISLGDRAGSSGKLTLANSLSMESDSTLLFEFKAANSADQLVVNGVTIKGGELSTAAIGGAVIAPGTKFVVIENTSDQPINGTFSNLAEGAIFTSGVYRFQTTYSGGTGNDFVITALSEKSR